MSCIIVVKQNLKTYPVLYLHSVRDLYYVQEFNNLPEFDRCFEAITFQNLEMTAKRHVIVCSTEVYGGSKLTNKQ